MSEYGCPVPNCTFETEDASASDSPGEAAPEAADASTTAVPTDSSSAPDVPISVQPPYGSPVIGQPAYGASAPPPDE
jgi:hypothetical protein